MSTTTTDTHPPTSTSSTTSLKTPPLPKDNPALNHSNDGSNIQISLLPDPAPAHAPALRAWTSLFGAKTTRPHPDEATFAQTYSRPNGRLLVASTPSNPVAGLIAYRKYDNRFSHIPALQFLGGDEAGNPDSHSDSDTPDGRHAGKGMGEVVEVVRLFVAPSHRNQGIATKLVRALVELARDDGVRYMYLHTHPFLPGAERLWEKERWGVLVREEEGVWRSIHMGRDLV